MHYMESCSTTPSGRRTLPDVDGDEKLNGLPKGLPAPCLEDGIDVYCIISESSRRCICPVGPAIGERLQREPECRFCPVISEDSNQRIHCRIWPGAHHQFIPSVTVQVSSGGDAAAVADFFRRPGEEAHPRYVGECRPVEVPAADVGAKGRGWSWCGDDLVHTVAIDISAADAHTVSGCVVGKVADPGD